LTVGKFASNFYDDDAPTSALAEDTWLGETMIVFARRAIFLIAVVFPFCAAAQPLVTTEEASLPNKDISKLGDERGIFPGPTIKLVSPSAKELNTRLIEASNIKSPFEFQLVFQAHNGSAIDWKTLKVTYLKTPEIPITDRLVPSHMTSDGITFADAELPPGSHQFKVEVSDTDQLPSWKVISLVVVSGP
jgi:hypothetical protein